MKKLTCRLVKFNSTALALLTTVLLGAGGAAAKDHKVKASETQAQVVAHISFTGLLDVDMAMQKRETKSTTSTCSTQKTKASRLLMSARPLNRKPLQ